MLWAVPILLLGVYGQAASLSAGLTTLVAFAVLQIIAFRHGGWQFVGPHVYYDVIRLARRGRSTMLRVFCLFAMLGGLFIVYLDFGRHERMRPNDFARISVQFAYALFAAQNLAILLLAPAYIASTVTEERERGTLELLFSTQMSNREIVLGILSARVVHLFGFVIAGFPILAIAQLWGGIDYLLIVGNLLNTLLNALTIGSLCLLISTLARGTTSAVMTAYAIVLPIGTCCSGTLNGFPLVLQDARMAGSFQAITVQDVGVLAMVHVLISAFCLWLAVMAIREHEPFAPPMIPPPPKSAPKPIEAKPTPTAAEPAAPPRPGMALDRIDIFGMPYALPPVRGDALWWKERYLGGPSLVFTPIFLVPAIPFIASVFCLVFAAIWNAIFEGSSGQRISHDMLADMVRFFYWAFLGFFLLSSTYRASASIARERQQQTLEPLLLLPIDRREILVAKFIGCLYRGWPWLALIGVDLIIGLFVGVFHPFSFICLVVGPLLMTAFFLIAGMYLSVMMRTVMRAYLTLVITLIVYISLSQMANTNDVLAFSYLNAFMWPIWGLHDSKPERILLALGVMAVYGLLASLLWWRLTVRFDDRSLL